MPEEVRAQKGQAAATSDQRHLQRAGVRDRRSNFYWKGTMNFPFSLRKTSLAVKKQAMHFKIGSYSSNKSLNYGNCKHWAASPSLSFSFVLASPTQRKKKKNLFSAAHTCFSNCSVRITNWDIHLVRASKLANPHAPLSREGWAVQAHSRRLVAPVVPAAPGPCHAWVHEEGSCCATERTGETIYLNRFYALLQKTGQNSDLFLREKAQDIAMVAIF